MATSSRGFENKAGDETVQLLFRGNPPQATTCNSIFNISSEDIIPDRQWKVNLPIVDQILVKVQVILWSQLLLPSLSITVDTAFRKDYTLQGCTKLTSALPGPLPVHLSFSWKDGRAGTVTTFTSHEPHPRAIGEAEDQVQCLFQHPGPRPPPTHTVLVIIFSTSRTRKWKTSN